MGVKIVNKLRLIDSIDDISAVHLEVKWTKYKTLQSLGKKYIHTKHTEIEAVRTCRYTNEDKYDSLSMYEMFENEQPMYYMSKYEFNISIDDMALIEDILAGVDEDKLIENNHDDYSKKYTISIDYRNLEEAGKKALDAHINRIYAWALKKKHIKDEENTKETRVQSIAIFILLSLAGYAMLTSFNGMLRLAIIASVFYLDANLISSILGLKNKLIIYRCNKVLDGVLVEEL